MKDAIYYYYNFLDIDTKESENILFFYSGNNNYALVPLERNPKELFAIIKCSVELTNLGFKCHKIIINRFNKPFSQINNNNYVLLELVGDLKRRIDIFEIVNNSKKYVINPKYSHKYSLNWADLWKRKVDYLENQMKSFGNNYPKILGNFSYYIGLAENAIIFYNHLSSDSKAQLTLSHRRVFFPNVWLNYGNPLSFVFDDPVRDYAEYIKSVFFYESVKSGYENFDLLLKIKKMNGNSLSLLLARLMFPSYYFDVFDDIIQNRKADKNLITIVEKSSEYERFLNYCFNKVKMIAKINSFPSWLL